MVVGRVGACSAWRRNQSQVVRSHNTSLWQIKRTQATRNTLLASSVVRGGSGQGSHRLPQRHIALFPGLRDSPPPQRFAPSALPGSFPEVPNQTVLLPERFTAPRRLAPSAVAWQVAKRRAPGGALTAAREADAICRNALPIDCSSLCGFANIVRA